MNNLPFGFERPEDSPGFLLWQTTMLWQRQIKKALEKHDLSHAQFVIMATLMWAEDHNYDPTQIFICRLIKLDKMTVSKSLKKLTSLGYVNRMEHAQDSRAKSIFLSPKGEKMVRILVPIVEGIDEKFFSKCTSSEQKQLNSFFKKLSKSEDDICHL